MTGLPRKRAPDPGGGGSGAPTGSSEDGPDWRDLAEATWLAAAWLASGRRASTPSQAPEADHPDDPAVPAPDPGTAGAPGSGPPPDGGPAGGSMEIPYAYPDSGPDLASAESGGGPLFRLPPAPAVPPARPLRLARVLRSLGRRVPTNEPGPLDEDATAQHGLSDGLWIPYLLPAHQRALDVVLLVDDTLTMRVWRGTVRRIADEAARSGAFRDVRTVRIKVPVEGPAVVCSADGRAGDPRELLDGSGRRLFLVVTDGLGAGWAAPAADELLSALARGGPTALVHLLPPYLRHRSSLYPFRAQFGAAGFGAANSALGCRPPHDIADPLRPLPEPDDGTVPVPVLSTHPASFTAWAELVTGEPGVHRTLPMLPAGALAKGTPAPGLRTPRIDGPRAAAAAVARFAGLASPLARHLALLLAVIPLDFDLIEELRERAVPEAGPDHVAEVMMGGLIDWEHGDHPDGSGPEFADGVREALLATGTRTQLARIVDVLAELRRGRGAAAPLRAAVRNPEDTPLPDTGSVGRPWLRIELAVLRALSGPHARRAARIVAGLTNAGGAVAREDSNGPGGDNLIAESTGETGVDDVVSAAGPDTTEHTEAGKADATMDLKAPEHRFVRSGQPKIMGNVPPKNPNFTGREILLEAVDEQLRQKETAAVLPHALHGMGGVGKSQIAIEYVYRHSAEYNVIWWVPSERESLILASLAELASFLGLDTGPQANTAVPAVQEALRSGKPYDNWLLVFDNAEDIDAVRAYFPSGGPGKIIVTSRNRDWERVATPLSVDVFDREESIALLQRRAPDLAASDADLLADALGDLPLAIEQAGAWHAATGMPVAEHLELLSQRRVEILDLDPNPDYPVPVAAAWNLSLDRLAQEHPAARQLLEVCALMAPEPIPLSLLRGGRSVEVSPELDPVLRDPVLLARATRELSKFSLIRLDHKRGTLQMHRLMQSVLVNGLDPAAETRLRHAVHQLLATAKPGEGASPELWPAYQALLPHVQASGAVRSSDPWVRDLVLDVVFFLYYWGAHDTAMNMARQAWTVWQSQSGDDDIMVIRMAKLLAFMLGKFGSRDEALRLSEKALEESRGGEVPDEELISSMSQMAFSLRCQGEFESARTLDEDGFDMARRLFGPDDPAALQAAHSYGVSLRCCGAFTEARALDEDTARQFEVLYGPTNGFTLNSLNALAVDIRESGDYRSARLLMESTYEGYVANFGVNNAATISAARELAVCRRRAGATAEARELIEDTFARFTERYGTEYTDTLAAAMNAVVDRRITGDLAQSRDLGEKIVVRYRGALGEDHAATVSALVNLAATLRAVGDIDGAERCDIEAVERFTTRLGERHPNTLTARISRANDHYARLDFAAARTVDEAVLPLLDDVLGPDHPLTLTCTAHLALDLRGLGESAAADRLNAQAVEGLTRVLGADHPWRTAAQLHQRIECDIAPMPL